MNARFVFGALAAIAIAIPSIASAETTVIKKYGDRDHLRGARAEVHGLFHRRHFDRDRKVVIIKHRHHDRMY